MSKFGIDCSHYNQIDWSKLNVNFVIAKATEGLTFKDPTYQASKAECSKRGITFGSYHFFRDVDPIVQAEFFVKNVGDLLEGEMLALDFEIHITDPVGKCTAFLKRVEEMTGYKPIIYMYSSLANLDWDTSYPLWIADPSPKPRTGKWKDYFIWQYGQEAVAGAGRVDVDLMNDNYFNPPKPMYTPYSQRDIRWRFKFLGNSWSTIGSYGCKLCSLSMMVNKTPPEVNELLKKGGAFMKDLIIDEVAAKVLGLDYLGKDTNINNEPQFSPTIKEVKFNGYQHFVLRLFENGQKSILDPWDGQRKRIDFFPFVSYRKFKIKLP
jgi:lysozyme